MENKETFLKKLISDYRRIGVKQKQTIKILLIGFFFVGFLVSSLLTYFLNQRAISLSGLQNTRVSTNAIFQISTPKTSVKKGETIAVLFSLDTQNQPVEATNFDINYDPDYLLPVKYTMGNFFKLYPKKENVNNLISIYGATDIENNMFIIPAGKGTVATISFQTLKPVKKTSILLNEKTSTVAAKGKNILKNLKNLDITIEWKN